MPTRRATRGCGCLTICLLALLIAGAGGYFFRESLATMAGSFLIRDEPPVKADAALVLGGDGTGDRTLKAAQLAQAGWVPIVYLSGPKILVGYESGGMLAFALKHGFRESMFQEIKHDSKSTREEAALVTAELRRRGVHRILLVTSLFHTRRAYYLFHRAAPDMEIHIVAAPDPDFTPATWWKSREGQKIFVLEWAKTLAAWMGI
jgi:uncharacterized SAM-binding protein YcdF (DUF218 family)